MPTTSSVILLKLKEIHVYVRRERLVPITIHVTSRPIKTNIAIWCVLAWCGADPDRDIQVLLRHLNARQ